MNKKTQPMRNHKSLFLDQVKKQVSKEKEKAKEHQTNISVANINKSQEVTPTRTHRRESMQLHKIANASFKEYLQNLITDLQSKKQRLQACIKMFSLFQGHNGGLRCIEHNNVQTVYCLSQRRVLCTNCVFGGAKHRTHKLKPLKDSIQYIQEDNKLLNKIIESDLVNMNESIKNSQWNTLKLESQLKNQLEKLEVDYRYKKDHLEQKYALERQGLKRVFQALIQKSKMCERFTQQLKFKTWQASSKLGISKSSDSINIEASISKQVFLVKLSEITQVKVKAISTKQIDKLNKSILKS